jgi:hypothetical protein
MAIKTFKDIVGNQGYRVDKKDREIFEREVRRGLFGIDQSDIIEFVLYDSADNALPQEASNGKKVRYISITDNNIKKYFSKTDKTKYNVKSNKADEFYVNVELLIREAGYSNGIFKSSVSLLNRRLGSEDKLYDRAWIHEISPSRTEVRVLQVIDESTGQPNADLAERYKTFVECEDFAADVITFLDEFSAQFDIRKVIQEMLTIRGNVVQGEGYIKLIEKEFKIGNFENWLSLVKVTFDTALDNFRTNRYDNPLERDKFGQPTGESFGIGFGSSGIIQKLVSIAENCVEYHLPTQGELRTETKKTLAQQKTLDEVAQILKTVESNEEYDSDSPAAKQAAIRGCTDPKAKNYNPAATVSDICEYEYTVTKYRKVEIPPPPPPPKRCTDPAASNYGEIGECTYPPKPTGGGGGGGLNICEYGTRYTATAKDVSFAAGKTLGYIYPKILLDGERPTATCSVRVGTVTTGWPSWITLKQPSNGLPPGHGKYADGLVQFSMEPNTGPERTAVITIQGTGVARSASGTVRVTQLAGRGAVKPTYPAAGTIIKQECINGTTTQITVTADGSGGEKTTTRKNSPVCGYVAPQPREDDVVLEKDPYDDYVDFERDPVGTGPQNFGGGTSDTGGSTGGSSGGGCLVGNTMIELSTGKSIPIRDIKKGDYLNGLNILTLSSFADVEDNWLAEEIEEYDNIIHKVVGVQRITDTDVYSINDGLLEASTEHKHVVKSDGLWKIKTTQELNAGDIFLDRDKNEVMINSIVWDRTDEVFNIELDGKHTYYANNILTHNKANDFLGDPYGGDGSFVGDTKPGKEIQMM